MNTFSLFKGVNPKPVKTCTIVQVIEAIKGDHYKNKVEAIRAAPTKEAANEIKKTLDAVTFSAEFEKNRQAANAINYTGYMCLDIDNLPIEQLMKANEQLRNDEHTHILFLSPSGKGIKCVFKTSATAATHKETFLQIEQYLLELYDIQLDQSGKDVSRLCFLSYDPDIYHNASSTTFQYIAPATIEFEIPAAPAAPVQPTKRPVSAPAPINPLDTYATCVGLVDRLEMHRVELCFLYADWLKVLMSLSNLGEQGRDLAHRVSAISTSVYNQADTDKKFDHCLATTNKTASIASFIWKAKQKLPGYDKTQKQSTPTAATTAAKAVSAPAKGSANTDTENGAQNVDFITPDIDKYDQLKGVKIDNVKLLDLCKEILNFRRLEIHGNTTYVRLAGKLCEKVERKHLIDAVFQHVNKLPDKIELKTKTRDDDGNITYKTLFVPRHWVYAKMLSGQSTYLSEEKMLHLIDHENKHKFIKDTAKSGFFYYKNGVVEVTADGIGLKPYNAVDGFVWADTAHSREFIYRDYKDFSFYKFVRNISAPRDVTAAEAEKRFEDFRTLIGYILHGFFETKRKGIIFTDSRISEDAAGRSGKSLLCSAISRMTNSSEMSSRYVEIDGKDFDTENRFKYEAITPSTGIMVINDLKRNFDIEALFNAVTEGLQVRQMHQNPFRQHVKVVATVNKTVKLEGGSAIDRFIQVELTDHYSVSFQPKDDFKEWFFTDWSLEMWQMFDSFMCDCVRIYLTKGLCTPAAINLNDRYLLDRTNAEFVAWWDDKLKTGEIKPGHKYDKKELYEDFKVFFDDNPKWLTSQLFTKWLRLACQYSPLFGTINTKDHETKSNGKNYIQFPAAGGVVHTPNTEEENNTFDNDLNVDDDDTPF